VQAAEMELRHIKYFIAVAEELSFTRAAARLGIGQPPLSQQIKNLEAELGVSLLRRVSHGAKLTEAGNIFLREGRRVLAASEQAMADAKRAARGELGRLRIGFTGSAHFNPRVPSVICDFGRLYPRVELELEEANTCELLRQLALGTLDVAFAYARPEDGSVLDHLPIEDEPLAVVLPEGHRLSRQMAVHPSALAEDIFVMRHRDAGPELHKAVMAVCRSAGFEPRLGQEAPQLAAVINLVAAGSGVSIVPRSMQQMRSTGVIYLPMEGPQAYVTLSLVWRRSERANAIRNFVALVKEPGKLNSRSPTG
jgi:DNA-binding transcriptional LysR family regulator